MKHKFYALIIIIASHIFLLSGCTLKQKQPLTGTQIYFDTVVNIQIFDFNDKNILENCFSYCREFEEQISRTISTSEISKINHAKGQPVEVSDRTIELLKEGIRYGDLTNGKFDITIEPLSSLWDFKAENPKIPSAEDIEEARSHVNYKNILIEGNTVTLADPKAAIDLGGIAKGYMADQLKAYLESEGVQSALINLGGNVLTIGRKIDGSNFHIGIQKPFDEYNTPITTVSVRDQSVVSSGVYERYFESDGKIYHHILDPATGYPYENGLLSVTILSDRSVDGDALSTSCFALGLEEGMKLIQSLDGIDAIFITDDYQIHKSY